MFPDNDMASNIVRWMKTKLHGYKPFTGNFFFFVVTRVFKEKKKFALSIHDKTVCKCLWPKETLFFVFLLEMAIKKSFSKTTVIYVQELL